MEPLGVAIERWHAASPEEKDEIIQQKRERMLDVVKRRWKGESFGSIAKSYGVTPTQAHHDYKRFLREMYEVEHKDIMLQKASEVHKLDQLMASKMDAALRGDDEAIATVLKLQTQKARMLGLYAPVKVKMDHRVNDMRDGNDSVNPEVMQRKMVALWKRLKARGFPVSSELDKWAKEIIVEGEVVQESGPEGPSSAETSAPNAQNPSNDPTTDGGS